MKKCYKIFLGMLCAMALAGCGENKVEESTPSVAYEEEISVVEKEEVAAVKWATKYEVHNLAAKHQMIPYILFDFIFDAIEHQNLLKKNLEKQEKH